MQQVLLTNNVRPVEVNTGDLQCHRTACLFKRFVTDCSVCLANFWVLNLQWTMFATTFSDIFIMSQNKMACAIVKAEVMHIRLQ